jgi:hypothetical protein
MDVNRASAEYAVKFQSEGAPEQFYVNLGSRYRSLKYHRREQVISRRSVMRRQPMIERCCLIAVHRAKSAIFGRC